MCAWVVCTQSAPSAYSSSCVFVVVFFLRRRITVLRPHVCTHSVKEDGVGAVDAVVVADMPMLADSGAGFVLEGVWGVLRVM
jgi:hypothetical protein